MCSASARQCLAKSKLQCLRAPWQRKDLTAAGYVVDDVQPVRYHDVVICESVTYLTTAEQHRRGVAAFALQAFYFNAVDAPLTINALDVVTPLRERFHRGLAPMTYFVCSYRLSLSAINLTVFRLLRFLRRLRPGVNIEYCAIAFLENTEIIRL